MSLEWNEQMLNLCYTTADLLTLWAHKMGLPFARDYQQSTEVPLTIDELHHQWTQLTDAKLATYGVFLNRYDHTMEIMGYPTRATHIFATDNQVAIYLYGGFADVLAKLKWTAPAQLGHDPTNISWHQYWHGATYTRWDDIAPLLTNRSLPACQPDLPLDLLDQLKEKGRLDLIEDRPGATPYDTKLLN